MTLRELIEDLEYENINGNLDIEISKIEYDSRKVEDNTVFVAIEGFNVDGHSYIDKAIKNGAKAIICSKKTNNYDNVTIIKVKDTREALAKISIKYYDYPFKKLKIIGVTGTNGKTTSTYMLRDILKNSGYKTGIIGTIANYIEDKVIETERTTPESLELHKLLNEMVSSGVEYCIMEVSSHSLALKRVFGIEFDYGIFTNLTQDHLDFHRTFEEYFNSKKILFSNSKVAVSNIDDQYGKIIFSNFGGITYSINDESNFKAKDIVSSSRGSEFNLLKDNNIEGKISIPMIGEYNISNALSVISVAYLESIPLKNIQEGLKNTSVPGRCENLSHKYKLDYDILLDYAHSPDGVKNFLENTRKFTEGRLITVLGCGGDRDKTKRPIMGEIATRISDYTIITSDNPRSEDKNAIIRDIVAGINTKENYEIESDRLKAIYKAILMGRKGDIVAILGKGHETYQEINNVKYDFDEKKIVCKIIEEEIM